MSTPETQTTDISEKLGNIAVDAAEEVAEQAERFAEFARQLSRTKIRFTLLGVAVGVTAGATAGYFLTKRRLETKYSKIADMEIEEMRQHFRAKTKAAEATAQKLSPAQDIVTERGYTISEDITPPMAIQPPAREVIEEEPTEEPSPEPEIRNVFEEARVTHVWDWHAERRNRSVDIPYVIHIDEREELDYQVVTLEYYEGDDTLCDEQEEPIPQEDWDELIGESNLTRFGHGSNDASVVYIRNDRLEIIYEVCKSPGSFSEAVHGFHHGDIYRGNLERMRKRERDEQED